MNSSYMRVLELTIFLKFSGLPLIRVTIVYFVAENLVLWARSEPLGYAVNLLQAGTE